MSHLFFTKRMEKDCFVTNLFFDGAALEETSFQKFYIDSSEKSYHPHPQIIHQMWAGHTDTYLSMVQSIYFAFPLTSIIISMIGRQCSRMLKPHSHWAYYLLGCLSKKIIFQYISHHFTPRNLR